MTANTYTFALPDLGEGLIEATIVEWCVQVGAHVERDALLVELETTKASIELPCPVAGRVSELHAAVGEVVAVGGPLVTLEVDAQPGIVGTVTPQSRPTRTVHLTPPPGR
jgi:pyruvate dehydrogenase E2 component (dihydrolipoamide acetyltransferase)